MLGFPLACAARLGTSMAFTVKELVKPIAFLLGVMGVGAFLAGVIAFIFGSKGSIQIPPVFASVLPSEKHIPFLVDMWAHSASYFFGFFGGIILIVHIWRRREKAAHKASATTP